MSSLYDLTYWATATVYKKNAFVLQNNFWYYAIQSHTSGADFNTDNNAGLWQGTFNDGTVTKPYFGWKLSYNWTNPHQPKVKTISFGDGFAQNIRDGLSNDLLTFDATFENRSLDESTAILHFFYIRAGSESFFFIPPDPYATLKRFLVKNYTPKQNFYDNYSISAHFEESLV